MQGTTPEISWRNWTRILARSTGSCEPIIHIKCGGSPVDTDRPESNPCFQTHCCAATQLCSHSPLKWVVLLKIESSHIQCHELFYYGKDF